MPPGPSAPSWPPPLPTLPARPGAARTRNPVSAYMVGADLSKKQLQPGRVFLVAYVDDPEWWHERLLLWPSDAGEWRVPPDGDEYCQAVEDWVSVYDMTGTKKHPSGLRGGLVQFSETLTDPILLELIKNARRETRGGQDGTPADQLPEEPSLWYTWSGAERPLQGAPVKTQLARKLHGGAAS